METKNNKAGKFVLNDDEQIGLSLVTEIILNIVIMVRVMTKIITVQSENDWFKNTEIIENKADFWPCYFFAHIKSFSFLFTEFPLC